MNYPKAIVIAAALIAGAIAFSVRAQANPNLLGRYQIASAQNTLLSSVWRVDVQTGQLVWCFLNERSRKVNCFYKNGALLPSGSY